MKKLFAILAAGVAVATLALAQPLTTSLFSGNELLNITTTAGSGAQTTLSSLNGVTAATTNATVGFGTVNLSNTAEYYILTGTTATGTINVPNPASNGERIVIANGNNAISGTVTVGLVSSSSPQTQTQNAGANFSGTIAANSSIEFIYVWTTPPSQTGVWYRVR